MEFHLKIKPFDCQNGLSLPRETLESLSVMVLQLAAQPGALTLHVFLYYPLYFSPENADANFHTEEDSWPQGVVWPQGVICPKGVMETE